jgi:hypothetical protein
MEPGELVEMVAEWPDGTWCFVQDLPTMTDKDDNYQVVELSAWRHYGA